MFVKRNVIKENNLTLTHEKLCKEWDYDKNELGPEFYTKGSAEKIWWICLCDNNHKWLCSIKNRACNNSECPLCNKFCNRYTTETFIKKAKELQPDYDYSKVIYKNITTKVEISCSNPEHESYLVTPHSFLSNNKCPECSGCKRYTTEDFIKKAIKIHPEYDYSLVDYINNNIKIKVKCNIKDHGIWEVRPASILLGIQCPKCAGNKKSTTEEFIEKAIKIHPEYDYSKVEYTNNYTKVLIGCNKIGHGFWLVTPSSFLQNYACPMCGGTKKSTTEEFIKKAIEIYPEYNYDEVKYENSTTKVIVKCKKHGYFNITPKMLLQGQGCNKCYDGFNESFVRIVFEKLFINKFLKIRPDFLKNPVTNRNLELDGFCEKLKIAFEYQGEQHERIVSRFKMTEDDLIKRKEYDQIKRNKCKENNIKLIEIPYFNKNFTKENLKDYIGYKCIELGIKLPEDFDDIIIDVKKICNEINQLKSNINKFLII